MTGADSWREEPFSSLGVATDRGIMRYLSVVLATVVLIGGCSSSESDDKFDALVELARTEALASTTTVTPTSSQPTTTAAPTTTTAATTTTTTEPAGPDRFDEIEALIEAYLASWETKDEQALRASVTDDFVIHEYIYSAGTGGLYEIIDDDADGIVSEGFGYDWENEIIGDSVVSGNGPWLVRHRQSWQEQANRYDGIATYDVVDDDGTLKIARHSWAGFIWTEF
jgi:hypothetical protein